MEQGPPEEKQEEAPLEAPKVVQQYDDVDPYVADHRDMVLSQSRMNLMAISQMSDLKANLILTLSAVLLQFALVRIADHDLPGPKIHFWVITIGSMITILLSTYSTLPKAPLFFKEKKDEGSTKVPNNILFFTSFIPLTLAEYKRHMTSILRSPPHTHQAIMEELHAHGRYISRKKYVPLRLAYVSFLLTWILGAILYVST